jgi:hypothetical protein
MTKDGFVFGGWFADEKFEIEVTFPIQGITGPREFWALWTEPCEECDDEGCCECEEACEEHGCDICEPCEDADCCICEEPCGKHACEICDPCDEPDCDVCDPPDYDCEACKDEGCDICDPPDYDCEACKDEGCNVCDPSPQLCPSCHSYPCICWTGGDNQGGGNIPDAGDEFEIDDMDVALVDFSSYAQELYLLDLYRGIGDNPDGSRDFALQSPLTRIQMVTLTIRLLGLDEEAVAYDGPNPFSDVVDEWMIPYAAFAHSIELAQGYGDGTFGPNDYATLQQFSTFLLRVLGYKSDGDEKDFDYADAIEFAIEIGLFDEEFLDRIAEEMADKEEFADIEEEVFLREYAVALMVYVLHMNKKDDEAGMILLDTLVEAEFITQEEADDFLAAIARINEMGF